MRHPLFVRGMKKTIRSAGSMALVVAAAVCSPSWSQSLPLYRLDPIAIGKTGVNGGYVAVDLNNTGSAVGNVHKLGRYSAVVWSGTPPAESALAAPARSAAEVVFAVNDAGIAGGAGQTRRGQVPLLWTPAVVTLPPFPGGQPFGKVVGINASGTAIGEVGGRPAVWPSSTSAPIDIGGDSGITAINDAGDLVGGSSIGGSAAHAFLWTAASGMIDLGTLAGTVYSTAVDVNLNREVIGTSGYPNQYRPFYWSPSTGILEMRAVPGFEQVEYFPEKINDQGLAVGRFADPTTNAAHSFLWTLATGMVDLATLIDPSDPLRLEVEGLSAVSINERNEVLVNVALRNVYPARPMILRPNR